MLITVAEAARLLRTNPQEVDQNLRNGQLTSRSISSSGGYRRWTSRIYCEKTTFKNFPNKI